MAVRVQAQVPTFYIIVIITTISQVIIIIIIIIINHRHGDKCVPTGLITPMCHAPGRPAHPESVLQRQTVV